MNKEERRRLEARRRQNRAKFLKRAVLGSFAALVLVVIYLALRS